MITPKYNRAFARSEWKKQRMTCADRRRNKRPADNKTPGAFGGNTEFREWLKTQ